MNDSAQTLWRKREIERRMESAEQAVADLRVRVESLNPYRNQVIEEVAVAIEHMESFGKDTISSFAIYIRSMKE